MTIQDEITKIESEIKSLQQKVSTLKQQQANCEHDWTKTVYDAETYKESYVIGYTVHGIHRDPQLGFHDARKDRWSRKCNKCGCTQYTYDNPQPVQPKVNWK